MRLSLIFAGVLAVGAVAWIGSGVLMGGPAETAPTGAFATEADGAANEPAPFRVRVADMVAEPYVEEVALLGHTAANRSVTIGAEIAGTVAEILVEEGAAVAAGTPLARLSTYDLEAQVEQARALLEQRRIEYNAAAQLSQSGYSARTQVATARANLNAAEAQVTAWQQQLDKTTITAPFDGLVNSVDVELGSYVREGDQVAMLVDLDPIVVVVHVTERQIGEVHVGAVASVRLITGVEADGVIRYVSAMADPSTRTFKVEIEIPNPDGSIIDGLTADVRIAGRQIMAHRISPAVIALADDGTIGVRIVAEGNTVAFVPIALLGDTTDGLWVAGLPEKVTLITVGQEYVSSGQVVEPVYQPTAALDDGPDTAS
ncbi:MAG: efflux RND transporter periplasmic adaptor subunit [Alphaproteobacteria bacterium]